MWTIDGKNPFDYLQAHRHEAAATGADVDNAPVYYARAIMAYVAAGRAERVFVAGTPRIDLLAKLYGYQDLADGSATKGSFSPSSLDRTFQAVHTTGWAILAMQALGEPRQRPLRARRDVARHPAERADGGFPPQPGDASNCEDTALAIQALSSPPTAPSTPATSPRRAQYLKASQQRRRRLPVQPGGTHRRLGHLGRHPGHPRHGREARRRRLDGRRATRPRPPSPRSS